MINQEEYAACQRRGHDEPTSHSDGWVPCKHCGVWRRRVVTMEEREDDPPEAEIDLRFKADLQLAKMKAEMDEREKAKRARWEGRERE